MLARVHDEARAVAILSQGLSPRLCIRREQRETRQELAALSKYVLDLEKRQSRRYDGLSGQMTEMKEDLEIMIKSELMGRLASFEARIDQKIEDLLK